MSFIVMKQRVRPEYSEDWLTLVESFTQATRGEPGNICFDWFRSVEDADTWLLVEAFSDAEAGKRHVESGHFQAVLDGSRASGRGGTSAGTAHCKGRDERRLSPATCEFRGS